jgi:hypothetical protein
LKLRKECAFCRKIQTGMFYVLFFFYLKHVAINTALWSRVPGHMSNSKRNSEIVQLENQCSVEAKGNTSVACNFWAQL